ncbi:hypothetical protein [Cellulomonas soli]
MTSVPGPSSPRGRPRGLRRARPPVDRVDTATFAGRRLAEQLHDLLVQRGVSCGRLQIAARTDDGEDLVRTWRTDLGGWGGLTPARITDRIRWQLEGWLTGAAVEAARERSRLTGGRDRRRARDPHDDDLLEVPDPDLLGEEPHPVTLVHLTVTALDVAPAGAEQGRLWGGPSGGDLRAHRALDRVQGIVGLDGVLQATLQGGRDVRDQVHLRPWGEQSAPTRPSTGRGRGGCPTPHRPPCHPCPNRSTCSTPAGCPWESTPGAA